MDQLSSHFSRLQVQGTSASQIVSENYNNAININISIDELSSKLQRLDIRQATPPAPTVEDVPEEEEVEKNPSSQTPPQTQPLSSNPTTSQQTTHRPIPHSHSGNLSHDTLLLDEIFPLLLPNPGFHAALTYRDIVAGFERIYGLKHAKARILVDRAMGTSRALPVSIMGRIERVDLEAAPRVEVRNRWLGKIGRLMSSMNVRRKEPGRRRRVVEGRKVVEGRVSRV